MKALRAVLKRSVTLRLLARWARANTYAYPRWKPILERDREAWTEARRRARHGPKILLATGVGGHPYAVALESLLGVALTLRGVDVHYLLCDALLPGCELTETTWFPDHSKFVRGGPQRTLCRVCFAPALRAYHPLDLPVHRYRDLLSPEEAREATELARRLRPAEIEAYMLDGVAVGEHARAGALRFYARGTLAGEPHAEGVLRRYFHASLLTAFIAQRLFATVPVRCAVFQHGIYVPQGVVGEVARRDGVRIVNWNVAYRKQRFIFSHHDTYHRTLATEPAENWDGLTLTPRMDREVVGYLKSRWRGTQDWIWFHERPIEDVDVIARELGIDFDKPCVGMLTNVVWDAQIHYPANAFPTMIDWAVKTIQYFAKRPELQLIIRVHPAEIRGTLRSRQPMVDEIRAHFAELPRNVVVIPPEKPISTYAVMERCNAVIIYGTKTGVELSSVGIPVIVAGEAWLRGKGISLDASSESEYFELLDRLPFSARLSPDAVQRARTYAYHFFFRRMIPLEFTKPTGGWLPYRLDVAALGDLWPGRSRGLDVICDGIVNGNEFIYPEEQGSATS